MAGCRSDMLNMSYMSVTSVNVWTQMLVSSLGEKKHDVNLVNYGLS